jgi:hypothetical protein
LKLFAGFFQTLGADFLPLAVDLFGLEVDAEFPEGLDVGVADFVAGRRAASADIAGPAHIRFAQVIKFIKFVKFIKS